MALPFSAIGNTSREQVWRGGAESGDSFRAGKMLSAFREHTDEASRGMKGKVLLPLEQGRQG